LHGNNFNGTIPTGWNLRDLFYLDLGNNDLTGSVPLDWTQGRDKMNSLRILYLNNNRLSGTLDPQFIALIGSGRLAMMILHDNEFTGQLPGNYTFVNHMDIIEVQNNNFDSVDTAICSMIVFSIGEMVSLKADCEVCRCKWFCDRDECY